MNALQEKIGDLMAQLWEARVQINSLEGEKALLLAKTDNRKRLTPLDVRHMRFLWRFGDWTQAELADYYAVSTSTVSRTVRRIYHGDI